MKNKLMILAAALALGAAAKAEIDPQVLSSIESATGWTVEELATGLAMLDRVYSNDCATAAGRVRWHGKVVENRVDTNALTQTQIHEDGYAHVRKFSSVSAMPVSARLSAAERKARAEAAARVRAEAEAKRKAERLEWLLENATAEISRLSAKYPALLAGLLYTNEVHNLQTELNVPVTVTIEPQGGAAR